MGQVSWVRAAFIMILLSLTFGTVQLIESKEVRLDYPIRLKEVHLVDSSWNKGEEIHIENNIIAALDLDDYLYQKYNSQDENISLYIGFYHSADKVGAAHDPLVCFQGQGWIVSNRQSGNIPIANSQHSVNYSSMVAKNGQHEEYVFYWFQSYKETGYTTYEQKLKMVFNRLTGHGTSNAFVRITTSIVDGSIQQAHDRSVRFVQSFYPKFHNYVARVKE